MKFCRNFADNLENVEIFWIFEFSSENSWILQEFFWRQASNLLKASISSFDSAREWALTRGSSRVVRIVASAQFVSLLFIFLRRRLVFSVACYFDEVVFSWFSFDSKNSDRTPIWIVRLVRSLADRTFQLRFSSLPYEAVCTENLSPFLKLLPCHGMAGIAALLRPYPLAAALVERFDIELFSDFSAKWANFIGLVLFLYRRQILQENIRWKALDEIYKICMLLHRSDLNISEFFRQTFSHFLAKFCKNSFF